MNETVDVANNLLSIILLSFWWTFLSMLEVMSRQGDPKDQTNAGQTGEAEAAGDEQDFPELIEVEPDFSAAAFLQGACRAYEEILRAYALCDARTLKALLSKEVFRAFTHDLEARSARGETLELTFVGMQSARIASVGVGPESIEIAVQFQAQIIHAERSCAGEVILGDPGEVATVAELWTFSRSRREPTAPWILVETDAAGS